MTIDTTGNILEQRELGQGLRVSALGLGCMGMSYAYGSVSEAEGVKIIHRALDLGINFLDTAEVYGPHSNEQLLGSALRGRRASVVVATKFGFRFEGSKIVGVDSRPENVRKVCEESLGRLQTDYIDLFYQHRVDPSVPIEETVGAVAELVKRGKVRFLGLSEAGVATIRRAHATHPIAALQSEYSLWERGIEKEILPVCRELGIGLVPYSPLGRGFLTSNIPELEKLGVDDFRRTQPRFQEENAAQNRRAVSVLNEIAEETGAKPAQIALAWILSRGDHIVPIPGTKRIAYLEENLGALRVHLTAEQILRLEGISAKTAGARYTEKGMKTVGL